MRGTAILFESDLHLKVLEDIDKSLFYELKSHYSFNPLTKKIDRQLIQERVNTPVLWKEEDVDWDYGY